jgi:hypothetical protein
LKPRGARSSERQIFDKYDLYTRAVQSPDNDVEFLFDTFKDLRKKNPTTLREDFCGTFAICCEWAKLKGVNRAWGVDLDREPIEYGLVNNFFHLTPAQQSRVTIRRKNVLRSGVPPVDIIAAMNFSYFIFKERSVLIKYFESARRGLKRDGVMIMDVFGGQLCEEVNEERRKIENFFYYWDQQSFNPVTHEAKFAIHFQRPGQKKQRNVFKYDWRMWGIAELRDILAEAGFKRTVIYWEGTDRKGEGNGVFTRTDKGDDSEAWVAYIAALK